MQVGGGLQRDPVPQYRLAIQFGAAPERLEELTRVVFAEIDSVKANGASEADLRKVLEGLRREREVNLRENGWWMQALMNYDEFGWDPRLIPNPPISQTFTSGGRFVTSKLS